MKNKFIISVLALLALVVLSGCASKVEVAKVKIIPFPLYGPIGAGDEYAVKMFYSDEMGMPIEPKKK